MGDATDASMSAPGAIPLEDGCVHEGAVAAGVVVVVAGGNSNRDECTSSPAFIPSAVTVGSTIGPALETFGGQALLGSDVLPSEEYEAKLARRDFSAESRLLRRTRYQEEAERRRAARETRDELFRGGLGFFGGDVTVATPGSSSGAMAVAPPWSSSAAAISGVVGSEGQIFLGNNTEHVEQIRKAREEKPFLAQDQ